MRIAICDDDSQDLLDILSMLASYQKLRQTELYTQSFCNASELLSALEHENYDLLLLDVQMPGVNGIEAAREIRRTNETVMIVFLTSSSEYAVDSYSVQAANYLLKPITEDKLYPVLDRIADFLKKPEEAITVQTSSRVFRIPYRQIEYIEVMSKTIYFFLTNGSVKEAHGRLSDYEPALLAHYGFCKVHRSYLVNLQWVSEVRPKELITSSGRRVPVARSVYQKVRTAYTEFLFEDSDISSQAAGGGVSCNKRWSY